MWVLWCYRACGSSVGGQEREREGGGIDVGGGGARLPIPRIPPCFRGDSIVFLLWFSGRKVFRRDSFEGECKEDTFSSSAKPSFYFQALGNSYHLYYGFYGVISCLASFLYNTIMPNFMQ